jgi:hypothetical protein
MTRHAKNMLWAAATMGLTVMGAMLIHPAVILGTMLGVVTTLMRGDWNE